MRFSKAFVAAAVSLWAAATGTAQAADAYPLALSDVACFEPVGGAPELREMMKRRAGTDPGGMAAVVVRLEGSAETDIQAAFPAPRESRNPGFLQTGGRSIALELVGADGNLARGTTTFMPKDGYLMVTLPETGAAALGERRSRCSARHVFDPLPFRRLHDSVRQNLRAMLDQERQ